ncbi:hypothetical protein EB001_21355 [bacterium]|nr:hypothetical protein [bacterium]
MMKEPKRIKLSDFVPSQKEPEKIPLKSIHNDTDYEHIVTIEGAKILVKKTNENNSQNDS